MLIAINYANERFVTNRKWCSWSLRHIGKVDKVIEYSPDDLDQNFVKANSAILEYNRGGGLWLWKPYFILKTLRQLNDNDILLYCDSGTIIVHDLHVLTDCMKKNNDQIMAFQIPCLEKFFTKRETYYLMKCSDEKFFLSNQICTGYILFRRSKFTLNFVKQWLDFMCDERIVSPRKFCPEISERKHLIAHREDQSVFSLLCKMNSIKPYWDPSDFGDRPWEYASSQWQIVIPQVRNNSYPRCFLSNRTFPAWRYWMKAICKDCLYFLHIITWQDYLNKKNIPLENCIFE